MTRAVRMNDVFVVPGWRNQDFQEIATVFHEITGDLGRTHAFIL